MKRLVGLIVAAAMLTSAQPQSPGDVGTRFVQTGNDLLLDFDYQVPDSFVSLDWKVNNTVFLVSYNEIRLSIFSKYRNRIEFTDKKYSVILKNLQEADNGVYTAVLITLQERDKQLAQYKVKVQDPVSPVELTVDSDVSNESCNITVSCRTTESPFYVIDGTFPRDSQEGKKLSEVTASGSSLVVYLVVGKIICNHSNDVSQTKDVKMIEGLCSRQSGDVSPSISPYRWVLVAAVVAVFAVPTVIWILLFRQRKRNTIPRSV